ncbi:dihydropteroate synthase [Roseitranquillus sediminis]|uniref:dihydropteroate synthase n=1 Tax=Roseitranquillus sediminis TaxID=2809051 RepID=UPI001D0C3AD6|nr:dihydropteroate synthase [Roseitranquillus sediminis]
MASEGLYWRPLVQSGPAPEESVPVAGGPLWFALAERIERGGTRKIVAAHAVPDEVRERIAAERAALAALDMSRPRIMGILNATPDSFSDGGRLDPHDAERVRRMAGEADILDIGGESTRPGSVAVPAAEELRRVMPVVRSATAAGAVVSIDTRKAEVAKAALEAGATIVNDVSALLFDPEMAETAARRGAPVCLMHHQGDPATMQEAPRYDDVLLDVFDWLGARVAEAEAAGIPRARIVVDPGIGFGKTVDHNLALVRGISMLHGLGCPILLGASRKGFVGRIGQEPQADRRMPGTLAVSLAGLAQGVQIVRVHDTGAMRQALRLWLAVRGEGE